MNERERFRLLFRGAAVDRPPLLEEGVRDGVLEAWHDQGLPPGKTHLEIFGLTPHENIGPDITAIADGSVPLVSMPTRDYRRAFCVTRDRFPTDWRETVNALKTASISSASGHPVAFSGSGCRRLGDLSAGHARLDQRPGRRARQD